MFMPSIVCAQMCNRSFDSLFCKLLNKYTKHDWTRRLRSDTFDTQITDLYSVDTDNSMLIKSKTQNAVIFNGVFHVHIFQPYLQCSSPRRRKIYWSPKLLPAPMQITEMMFEISCMVSNTEFIKSCLFIVTLGQALILISYAKVHEGCFLLPPRPA